MEIREAQDRDRGPGHATAVLKADVDPGDQREVAEAVAQLGLPGQALLKGARLRRSEIPVVGADRISGTTGARRRAR